MKYRIGGDAVRATGLGGGGQALMDGKPTGDKKRDALIRLVSKDCYLSFFKGTKLDYDGVDAQAKEYEVRIGIEPSYMYESLKMFVISKTKENSYMVTGYSWGGWGTGIRSTRRYYSEYKTKSKFVRFIDNWHPQLYGVV